MDIEQIINEIDKIPPASMALIRENIREVGFPKGHIILRSGKLESHMYFLAKGIVRAYSVYDANEITFWFGKEGDPVISMKSYVNDEKGYENIELLESCSFYAIATDDLKALFQKDIHIANWGRRFAEKELIKTEERLISRQFGTAINRYQKLLDENPGLIQRVQLGHIASYLGITQVSLSRIRAGLNR